MELLVQFLTGVWDGFWALVSFLEPIVATLVGAIFNVDISPGDARGFTALSLFLVGAFVISRAFFRITRWRAFQPMTVVHHTARTPAQVVAGDMWNATRVFLIGAAIFGGLYFIGVIA